MIITLAGHVDHGKTSLVKALTGVNTDRLDEEKKRGLTIDLGFAYLGDGSLGFVDVPGHQKFIHNMVAGIAAQQHGLMVIAADDGPMPQSQEHLDILELIGVSSGTIALTKSDLVDEHRLIECEQEIAELVDKSSFENAAIFKTSINEPDSFKPLLDHLKKQLDRNETSSGEKVFRIAIDRAFAISGAGTVITGTVHSGSVTTDDTLIHYPSNKSVKVRGLRAQDSEVETAKLGDRCSINLSGISVDEIERGDWLSTMPLPKLTNLSVDLKALPNFPRAIKHWSPVHIYHATAHSTGRIALLKDNSIKPGDSGLADIVLDKPLASFRGDRLVLRDQSLDLTLGGAEVLLAQEKSVYRRRSQKRIAEIEANAVASFEQAALNLLGTGNAKISQIGQNWLVTQDAILKVLKKNDARVFEDFAIPLSDWQTHLKIASESVNNKPNGIRENELPKSIPKEYRQSILNELVQSGEVEQNGGVYRSTSSEIEIPNELKNIWRVLEAKLKAKQSPSSGDIAKELKKPQPGLEKQMRELVKLGKLIEIATHRFYLPETLQLIEKDIVELAQQGPFSVAQFRDFTGVSRNIAIEILEYFDRKGFTRRQDNTRTITQR